jgi:predicted transcriptional regulator
MRHYQVRDVMTAGPMTVTPSTPIKEVASILVRLQVGALPVVTPRDGVAGVVTETDLLRKEQLQRDPDGSHSAHLSYRDRRAIATAETAGALLGVVTRGTCCGSSSARTRPSRRRSSATCCRATSAPSPSWLI